MVGLWWGAGLCIQATKRLASLVCLWLCQGWTSSSIGSWRWKSIWLTPGRASWSDCGFFWNHLKTWCYLNAWLRLKSTKDKSKLSLPWCVFVFVDWLFCKTVCSQTIKKKEEVSAECLVGSLSGVLRFLIAYLFRDNPVILMQYMVMPLALGS